MTAYVLADAFERDAVLHSRCTDWAVVCAVPLEQTDCLLAPDARVFAAIVATLEAVIGAAAALAIRHRVDPVAAYGYRHADLVVVVGVGLWRALEEASPLVAERVRAALKARLASLRDLAAQTATAAAAALLVREYVHPMPAYKRLDAESAIHHRVCKGKRHKPIGAGCVACALVLVLGVGA